MEEEEAEVPTKRKGKEVGPKRMKKRRKIVIDNNMTELSSDHMKTMLRDTSDIIVQKRFKIADWQEEEEEEDFTTDRVNQLFESLPMERLLARPCLGDDGGLAPELLALWGRNMVKSECLFQHGQLPQKHSTTANFQILPLLPFVLAVTGKAGTQLPFRMRGAKGIEQRGAAAEEIMEEEAETEEVERARSQQQRESIEGEGVQMEEEEVDFGVAEQDVDFGAVETEEMETPFEVKDDFGQVEYKPDEIDEGSVASERSESSTFSLGAVNDLEKELYQVDDDDQPRQEVGDELVSHTSKWHKHTVRVFGMLKRNLKSHNADEDDAEEMEKQDQLSYNKLSAGCSRRTAAGVFFEMLQLKTWDYVELNQDKSYGDIVITPGIRFDEPPPSSS
jgi:cohesin complex subunit SCC1